jgi:cyanate lyase
VTSTDPRTHGVVLDKTDAGRIVARARARAGVRWNRLAEVLELPPVWTVAAFLGKHPVAQRHAVAVGELLNLDEDVVEALQVQPYRVADRAVSTDPTIYRFHEALQVYGEAIKELVHEEFGDGIMSAINFTMTVNRRPDAGGDRVVVTFDGKFLPYQW